MIEKSRNFEQGVEGLRGFAALAVLYTHLLTPGDLDPGFSLSSGWEVLEFSQGAVFLFFILSGYVIGLTNSKPFSSIEARRYGWRRIVRIVPLYILALLLGYFVKETNPLVLLQNIFFLQNPHPYGSFEIPPLPGNTNVWSLHFEAIYYAAFLLVWWKPKLLPWHLLAAFLGSIVLWFLPGELGQSWPVPILTTYLFGWVAWLLGWQLSERRPLPEAERSPWLTIVIFWIVTWQAKPLWHFLRRLDFLPEEPDPATIYNY
ncbi:MAG: acyltransferase, partial [Verrucomicrobiota bacterium]